MSTPDERHRRHGPQIPADRTEPPIDGGSGEAAADRLLSSLADLTLADPDPARSEALIARATATIARRRRSAERRATVVLRFYVQVVEPVAACALSAAFLASVVGQAISIIAQAHAGFLWR